MDIYSKLNSAEGIADLLTMGEFEPVYRLADEVRRKTVGDTVHLRAIIEFSNVCKRQCLYCGLNRDNKGLARFRMNREEILTTAKEAVEAGYRTIVLQSGEDEFFTADMMAGIISDIKSLVIRRPYDEAESTSLAVTVSCGERSMQDYELWRKAGADRYLLKHETADSTLYDKLHPCGTLKSRLECLKSLKKLGYETGSGFMVGLPEQMPVTLGKDLLLLKELKCDMAGIGPFISNPKTSLAGKPNGDPELTRRAVAIARLLLPKANLPVTTALSIMTDKEKRRQVLSVRSGENPFAFGANVVMKKVTPDEYKEAYEIYPAEFTKTDIVKDREELEEIIKKCGRMPL